jgi:hypothetical protein
MPVPNLDDRSDLAGGLDVDEVALIAPGLGDELGHLVRRTVTRRVRDEQLLKWSDLNLHCRRAGSVSVRRHGYLPGQWPPRFPP